MKKTLLKMSDGIMEMKASDNQITPKVKVKEENKSITTQGF